MFRFIDLLFRHQHSFNFTNFNMLRWLRSPFCFYICPMEKKYNLIEDKMTGKSYEINCEQLEPFEVVDLHTAIQVAKECVKHHLKGVMNLGMELRQNQLNGYSDKSGKEMLEEYIKENL